ncbi:hypothetical protein SNK05_006263 [Fusarium graminearum]
MRTPKENAQRLFTKGTEYMYLDANAEQRTVDFIVGVIAWEITGFWGTFWHQYFRRALTTISSSICRYSLRLPQPSRTLPEPRSFLGSAIVRVAVDWFSLPSSSKPPVLALAFFGSFIVGIVIEDTIQDLWRRITIATEHDGDDGVSLWYKLLGYIWVALWFMMVSPWYLLPQQSTAPGRYMVCTGELCEHHWRRHSQDVAAHQWGDLEGCSRH